MNSKSNFAMAAMKRKDKKQTEQIEALTAALAGMVHLFLCDDGPIFAEHPHAVDAVRLLAEQGRCEISRDRVGWVEAVWR